MTRARVTAATKVGLISLVLATASCSSDPPASCNTTSWVPPASFTCASTLAAQDAATATTVANDDGPAFTGTCGGYATWFHDGMLYGWLCVYDSSTGAFVGARRRSDTTVECTSGVANVPAMCATRGAYGDAGTD